ncbi:hypothetical protein [aff. Roholtiella sp. LEGE 12411]|uniref:hypothetical protein n=1 Tax=aff. Roholtiella sp. LEGE 12411 TaxID=1828822 RepID=UPI00187E8E0B|nr:hypothetical protein [aff. Roholtiella sp. LEGE 12411]MBE9037052.1 hypothetical protein [aff. Roholtiella sp. LEGE 12411]
MIDALGDNLTLSNVQSPRKRTLFMKVAGKLRQESGPRGMVVRRFRVRLPQELSV